MGVLGAMAPCRDIQAPLMAPLPGNVEPPPLKPAFPKESWSSLGNVKSNHFDYWVYNFENTVGGTVSMSTDRSSPG